MAEYTWDKAKQAGYKADIVPFTRQTIADGNLLNSDNLEVFSSRDQYLIDNANKVNASATSVYNTVKDNSATNWNNALLTGFSAIQFNDLAATVGKNYASGTIIWTFEYPFIISTASDKVTISAKDLNESYFLLAKSANSMVSYPDISNEPPRASNHGLAAVFGENCKQSENLVTAHVNNANVLFDNSETMDYHGIAFVYSQAKQAGFSFNHTTGSFFAGVGFNHSNDCQQAGIGINNSNGEFNGIALNTSTASYRAFSFCDSYSYADGAAYIGSVGEWRGAGIIHSTGYYAGLGYCYSVATNNSFAAANSTAQTASFAMCNSVASVNSLAIANATATDAAVALCDCSANQDGVAFNKSIAKNHALAFNNSYADGEGFAVWDSSATWESFAFANSYAYNGSVAISIASAKNGAIAIHQGSATNGSFAAHISTATNGSISLFYSYNIAGYRSIALNNSHNYAATGKYATFMWGMDNDNWYTNHSFLDYNSRLYAFTASWNGQSTAVGGPFNLENNAVLYNSTAATFGNTLTMHYSLTSGFVGNSISMYNSKVIATGAVDANIWNASNLYGMLQRPAKTYDATAHKHVAALYGSTLNLKNDTRYIPTADVIQNTTAFIDSVIALWNNTVVLEPYNIVNGIKLATSTVGLKPLDVFKPRYVYNTDRESEYMKQRNIIYVGL